MMFSKKSKASKSSSKKMSQARRIKQQERALNSSVSSLGGGVIGHEGDVLVHTDSTGYTSSVKSSPPMFHKSDLKRLETDCTRTETNSSLDSASVRDEQNLDAFLLEESNEEHNVGSSGPYSSWSNADLLQALEEAAEFEKQVLVARLLKEMDGRNLQLPDRKRQAGMKKSAEQVQHVITESMKSPEEGGWKKYGLSRGAKRDTMVYHRVNDKGEMTVRLETPIEASLISPLLAILNETDLYTTWLPSFQRPVKLGIQETGKIHQISRGTQLAFCKVDMPWPMKNREVVSKSLVGEAVEEAGAIAIRALALDDGDEEPGVTIPTCEPGFERINMDASLLFSRCPEDHPAVKRHAAKKQNKKRRSSITKGTEDADDPVLLATFTLFVTPSVNFVLKAVSGPMFAAMISFAEAVRDGKSGEQHKEAIANNRELYGWVDQIVGDLTRKCAN